MTEDVHATQLGGFCAVTCGRCRRGTWACADRAAPGAVAG